MNLLYFSFAPHWYLFNVVIRCYCSRDIISLFCLSLFLTSWLLVKDVYGSVDCDIVKLTAIWAAGLLIQF